jgi:hypothetical protein
MQENNLNLMMRIQEDENNYEELMKHQNSAIKFFNENFSHLYLFKNNGRPTIAHNLDDIQQALDAAQERENQDIQELHLFELVN